MLGDRQGVLGAQPLLAGRLRRRLLLLRELLGLEVDTFLRPAGPVGEVVGAGGEALQLRVQLVVGGGRLDRGRGVGRRRHRVLAVVGQGADGRGRDPRDTHHTGRGHGHRQQRGTLGRRTAAGTRRPAGGGTRGGSGHGRCGCRGDLFLVVEENRVRRDGRLAGGGQVGVVRGGFVVGTVVRLVVRDLLEGGRRVLLVLLVGRRAGTAVGVPLRGVVRAGVEGLRAPFPLLGLVRLAAGLVGLEPGARVPLAAGVGARGLGRDRGQLLLLGVPLRGVVRAGVVGGVVLGGVRVVVQGLVTARRPCLGVIRTRGPVTGKVAEQGVGLEGRGGLAGGVESGARRGVKTVGVVGTVRGEVVVLGFLGAVRRVVRRGGVGSRSRGGHCPRRVTVVHQLLFRLDNRGCQSSAATVPGGMRARQSSAGFRRAGNGHSAVFRGTAGTGLALCSERVRFQSVVQVLSADCRRALWAVVGGFVGGCVADGRARSACGAVTPPSDRLDAPRPRLLCVPCRALPVFRLRRRGARAGRDARCRSPARSARSGRGG